MRDDTYTSTQPLRKRQLILIACHVCYIRFIIFIFGETLLLLSSHFVGSCLVSRFYKIRAQSVPCANARLTISKMLRTALPCWFDATWFDAESAWWLDYRWSSWCCCYFHCYLVESCKICAHRLALKSKRNGNIQKRNALCLKWLFGILFSFVHDRAATVSIQKLETIIRRSVRRSMSNMWRRWPNLISFV